MRIGIDISQVVYGTGVSVYTRHLVENLVKVGPEHEFVLFAGSLRRRGELESFLARLEKKSKKVTGRISHLSPTLLNLIWNRLHILPIERFVGEADVFHTSDWAEPPAREAVKVTTVHDLSPILFPETASDQIRSVHLRKLAWVKKESKLVIAVSESTKADLVKHLSLEPERIRVIYEAPRPDVKKTTAKAVSSVKKKFSLKGDYLIAVGTDSRKNIARTITAFKKVKMRVKSLYLVIVGQADWVNGFRQTGKVKFIGTVSNRDLSALYSGASCLVYPSLYEGFGLPILEAFVCGCPVVTANISSLPEVAGDAAVLVDPKKPEEIAAGIEEAIASRDELAEKGYTQAKKFSWEAAARETLAVYKEAAGRQS